MRIINRGLLFSLIPALAFSAPFLCRNNNATYQVSAHCNTACGTTCEELDPLTSGTSGTCDTTNYEGFVYFNNKTYAISKATKFWTDIPNLAQPATSEINDVIKGIAGYYGGNGWIGVYDPLKSNNYNAIDPSRFKLTGGIDMVYTNWKSGQPDNKLDNVDIGVTAINGEHWAYIQADSTWLDDGYHVLYGGDYKPRRKALAELNGPLDCVSGTPKSTTSNTNGYYCGDGTGNVAQCTMGSVPTSSSACTPPSTWDNVKQKCKITYTATATSSSSTYTATASTAFGWDSCEGGNNSWLNAKNFCSSKGMRLPNYNETTKQGGNVPSCGAVNTLTGTLSTLDVAGCGKGPYIWGSGGVIGDQCTPTAFRCVGNITTYSCPSGGTLSGTTCTTTTTTYTCPSGGTLSGTTCTIYQDPSCPSGTQLNTSTGQCQPISACITPAVWNSTTQKCVSSTTTTYAATATAGLIWDNCETGSTLYMNNSCTSKGMRRPTSTETIAWGGTVPSCGGWTWTSSLAWGGKGGSYYKIWNGTSTSAALSAVSSVYNANRCVMNGTIYTCPSGGTLSGSTCTTAITTSADGVCPTNLTPDPSTGYCATPTVCPLGNYQCTLINSSTIENSDTTEGLNDKTDNGQTDASGNCLGQIYIFNGGDNRCRPSGIQTGFTDCCRKGTTWFGLGQCRESEKALGKLREFGSLDGNCHYIGDYCAEKWPLIGCVQKKKTYCCFSSPLARIIHEDGRPQLGIGWGSPESPQCRGFTPEEFQKIDFSKVDFSEWVNLQVIPNVQNGAVGNIQNVINNIDTNLAP